MISISHWGMYFIDGYDPEQGYLHVGYHRRTACLLHLY
jgi:hypothetical protein